MREDDAIRLRHMLDAAREAIEFAQGRTRVDLNGDRKLVLALVKDIEISSPYAEPERHRRYEHETRAFDLVEGRRMRPPVFGHIGPLADVTPGGIQAGNQLAKSDTSGTRSLGEHLLFRAVWSVCSEAGSGDGRLFGQ